MLRHLSRLAAHLLLLALVLTGVPSCAHQPAVSEEPYQKEASIRQLLEFIDFENQMRIMFTMSLSATTAEKLKKDGRLEEADAKLLSVIIAETFWEDVSNPLKEGAIKAYADIYSHQEIRDVLAFYQTSTGRKVARSQLRLELELMELGAKIGQELKEKHENPGYAEYFKERVKRKIPESLRQRLEAHDSLL